MTPTQREYRGHVFRIVYHAAEAFANACEALDLHLESLQKLQQG
jgi:hypothetical protein